MKKTFLIFAASTLLTGAFLPGCNSPEEKVENAQENVTEASKNLDEAQQQYLMEVENYRKEMTAKTEANDMTIADLKAKINTKKMEARAEYEKKISELEQKNNEMKKKIAEYKADSKENWENFKTEFNHDMEGLGNAFKDLTVNNTK